MKKDSKLIIFLLFLTLVLTACGTTQKSSANQETKSKNLLEKIKAEGTIKIGTEGTYPPFTYHDGAGKLTGFDVEVAEEVAKRLGIKAEFIETQWDGIFAGLDSKRFDLIANQVSITSQRQEKYDFSDPYIVTRPVLIIRNDNDKMKAFEDLKGKKSAQSLTSNQLDVAKSYGAEIVSVEGFNQAIDLLISKRVDATVNDKLSYLELKKQKPDSPLKIAAELGDADENAFMFKKGSNKELIEAINKALSDMKNDGTYVSISQKYFGTDVSK